MPHWGWRTFILVMYIGVIVVACTTTQNFTPIPSTKLPPLTLTLRITNNLSPPKATLTPLITTPELLNASTPFHYVLSDGETLDDILNRFDVSVERLQLENTYVDLSLIRSGYPVLIPQPEETPFPQPFTISQPVCTITNSDTLYCLGTVKNTSNMILQHVALRLYLLDDNQVMIEERTIDLTQRDFYPETIAPYHVFLPIDDRVNQLVFMPARAVSANVVPLEIVANTKSVEIVGSQYTVLASLDLPAENHFQRIRAVLTVYDSNQQPVNYAVRDIPANEQALEISALLPDNIATYTHRLHVEGYP